MLYSPRTLIGVPAAHEEKVKRRYASLSQHSHNSPYVGTEVQAGCVFA